MMSVPLGVLVSKSGLITRSNCSSVSITEKSRSGWKFDGNTNRPCLFTTKGCIIRLSPIDSQLGDVALLVGLMDYKVVSPEAMAQRLTLPVWGNGTAAGRTPRLR